MCIRDRCKEKLAKAIRENRGVPLNHTGDYTAAEWCRLWFETYSKPNIRYNTAKGLSLIHIFKRPIGKIVALFLILMPFLYFEINFVYDK